jgi:hypothetical protein
MSRVIFHAVSQPDMRLLAMYANTHNWYAAPEKFAPDGIRNDYPRFFPPCNFKYDRTKGYFRFRLNSCCNPD